MKRITQIILSITILVALSGCTIDNVFLDAADMFANETVGPEYEAYVDADTDLTESEKRVRHGNLDTFRAAIVAGRLAAAGD